MNYSGYLSGPEQEAPAYLTDLTLTLASPVGIQTVTFDLTFSRPMDQSVDPTVAFGATEPYTTYQVVDNAQWLDDSHWRATYGMEIPTDTRFSFQVDYAGAIADTTPPPAPTVWACASSDPSTLSASWAASDPESSITEYRYAIGTAPGAVDVIDWTSTGTATSVTRSGLNLTAGRPYYFAVQARNVGGLWSAAGLGTGAMAGTPCPSCDFTGNPISGTVPLMVSFTSVVTGNATSYAWEFGDGDTDTQAHPSHTYAEAAGGREIYRCASGIIWCGAQQ